MNDLSQKIRIGTRGSPLALKQTEMVRHAIALAAPEIQTEVIVIKTSGDWSPEQGDVRLEISAGGKGQFAKEIEAALLAGHVDIGVHSMKDMEANLPAGLSIIHMLPRANPFDAVLINKTVISEDLLSKNGQNILMALPKNSVVGSSSVRRQAFLLAKRPDLKVVPLRGNVHTRIEKLRAGQVDMTLLAVAGLERLGLGHEIDARLSADEILPSAGQGAVGIEVRNTDLDAYPHFVKMLSVINCQKTALCVSAERAALRILDGSCHTPIGAYALIEQGEIYLRLAIAALDGSAIYYKEGRAVAPETLVQAEAFGAALAQKLKAATPPGLLRQQIEAGK
jgi:hydroxymethylbilane synthase